MVITKFYLIAQRYFPEENRNTASCRLSRWIQNCTPLLTDLKQLGHRLKSRYLTPREIERIYYHLGEP